MNEQSLSYKTMKNVSYNFLGFLVPIVFSIFVTPIIVFRLGIELYGFLILLNTISSLLGLVDFGITTAMVKYISEYNTVNSRDKLKRLIYSSNSLFLLIALLGFIIFIAIGYFGKNFFSSHSISQHDFFIFFFLAGSSFFVNIATSVYVVIPRAIQRFDVGMKMGLFRLTISSFSTLVLILLGYKLKAVLIFALIFDIFSSIVFRIVVKKILPLAKFKVAWDSSEIKKLYKFGLVSFIGSVADSFLYEFDRLLIPIFLGPTALPYYSLPGSVAAKTQGVNNSLSGVLMPMSSGLNGLNDNERIKKLYIRAFRLLTVVASGLTITIIVFSYNLMKYWLSEDFAIKSQNILIILALTYFMLSLTAPLIQFLLGMSKTKVVATFSMSMALINLILLLILLPVLGVVGAAWSFLFATLPSLYLFYFVEKKILFLQNRARAHFVNYSKIAICSLIYYFLISHLILPHVNSRATLIFFGIFSTILYFVIYKILGFFEEEDWRTFVEFKNLALKKINLFSNN